MRFLSVIFTTLLVTVLFQPVLGQNAFSYEDQKLVKSFEKRATDYANLRNKIEKRLPKLPKAATMEQISAHKLALRESIRKNRSKARVGEIFFPESAGMIRRMINDEFKGTWEGSEIRSNVLEAETKGVPVQINAVYPDSAELVEMSPTLLLSLPKLPRSLRYRFIGRSLVIMDRDNSLIIDYMKDALP